MIQIIEDDLVTSHIISALLKRMRYAYCEAHTGAEALQQLRTRPIDMVIADMMLPDMNGLDLLKAKYSMPHLRDIPVLCCTAQADIETVEAALGFGAVDFVKKPIAIQSFAGRINRAMERSPVRWESWREMSKRMRFYNRTIQPMLAIANQVLHELDDALALGQVGPVNVPLLNSVVTRARGAALNVGAIRTVQQIDRLWKGDGAADDIEHLRAAMVIELASFEEAIRTRNSQGDMATSENHAERQQAAAGSF
jgi:DNA-binding response OmpR family regulator